MLIFLELIAALYFSPLDAAGLPQGSEGSGATLEGVRLCQHCAHH